MAKYISLDPKVMGVLIEHGRSFHLSAASLEAAAVHLEACGEMPTFRIEGVGDGCEVLELVRGANGAGPLDGAEAVV